MSRPQISALLCGVGLLLGFALAPAVIPNPFFKVVLGDALPMLVILATFVVCVRNSVDSHGHTRLFWGLISAGMGMWFFNQASWTWYEVILRKPLPEPHVGDVVLFLHIVPFTAALALRPHRADESEGTLLSALNVTILLIWWLVVYAFFVFPDEYLTTNTSAYNPRWDLLYLVEGLILMAVALWTFMTSYGAWRSVYRNLFLANALYTLSSEAMNSALTRGIYQTGGLYDLPFLGATFAFLWAALAGRRCLRETEAGPALADHKLPVASVLARLALLSLPVMGYWALYLSDDTLYLRRVRFLVTMGGMAVLAFVVLLKQHLLDRRLMGLLNHSRQSFDNLQRLHSRAIQQAKLASLGELVALAAGELEHPLSAILNNSEKLAASSSLTREQLSNAQKIGQQARRTRELVADLLSFAQQTPGDKNPLELKPLVQRAVQMEGLKLENKKVAVTVDSAEPLPRVLGNANQLLQAFLQIVENAMDALQEAGGGKLQVSLWREGNEVVVQFADSGPGLLDPERVFDPFYTTKPVGKGTGLGLSATYGVVQDHKGQIMCYNRPEGGATFEIRLPALRTGAQVAHA